MQWIDIAILLVALLAGCSEMPTQRESILREGSTEEFGNAGYGCADTVAVAMNAGVDYKTTVDRALRCNREAMHMLFWLTKHAGFDAASAQGHAAVLGEAMRYHGDRYFGMCLSWESKEIREDVRGYLLYDTGDSEEALVYLRYLYPTTFPKEDK